MVGERLRRWERRRREEIRCWRGGVQIRSPTNFTWCVHAPPSTQGEFVSHNNAKTSQRETATEKGRLNKRILARDTRKMGGALETAPVVAPLRLGSRPILGHLCFGPRFEWNISIQYILNLFWGKLLKLVSAIAVHQIILAFFKLLKLHKPVAVHSLSLPFRFSL